jgi:DNA (cytosine-5)-methyltransferase 1
MKIHIDLFSGIGGFAYAIDQVYEKEKIKHIFCDSDKFCQKVLAKHWPESKIYGDIREITADSPDTGIKGMRKRKDEVFLLTGGFPCQPFSQAGKRKGTDDDRYLWPEMLRVIQLTKPQWVIAENVRGLLTQQGGLVFEQVCLDLEASDYEVQPFIIPAVAVNAPHRRDRVWIVAYKQSKGLSGGRETGSEIKKRNARRRRFTNNDKDVADTKYTGLERRNDTTTKYRKDKGVQFGTENWKQNWLEVATELCGVDDGLPAKLDGFELSKARHRVERLKSLGNAIVPQVAVEIIKAIKESEKN